MNPVHVRIFYPADPMGVVPGGIDTFLRGLLKWGPPQLQFSLVGMSTQVAERPLHQWTRCSLGRRSFDFYPVVQVADAAARSRIPLSARYTWGLVRGPRSLRTGFDIFDFHRLEPGLLFRGDARPKNAFFHQDPVVVRNAHSDIVWRRVPALYERVEGAVFKGLASAWCVRESGVLTLQQRYPAQAGGIRFISTWVDTEVFTWGSSGQRAAARHALQQRLGVEANAKLIATVGRLDSQKDPQLMLQSFARLVHEGHNLAWLVVGDGVLRPELQAAVQAAGLSGRVHFLGLMPPAQISRVLAGCDLYALSSAYEGMPMALLEALASGLPVATTDVGEVRRVVRPGQNGAISQARTPEAFAAALREVLQGLTPMSGEPAVAAIEAYQPQQVLQPVYENYLRLGQAGQGSAPVAQHRPAATAAQRSSEDYAFRRRERVIGVPIDVLADARARSVITEWGARKQSRYVCYVNVHSAVTAHREARHGRVVEQADLAVSDGAPIAWTLRKKGHTQQQRLDGPGMMWRLCSDAEARGLPIGLYGSTPERLGELHAVFAKAFPRLRVAYSHAPPFRPLSAEEDKAVVDAVNASGAGLLFVSLGCPKQELWMADHRGRIQAVMLGVGAAFDFHTGAVSHAPAWMRERGLEWLHRLVKEPRRLWRRYLDTNTVFVVKTGLELLRAGPVRPQLAVMPAEPFAQSQAASLEVETVSSQVSGFMSTKLDLSHLSELLVRVDSALAHRSGRVVEFIASGEGEGTSTLAESYAALSVASMGRKVLVLDAHASSADDEGVFSALARGEDLKPVIARREEGWFKGSLLPHVAGEAQFTLLARTELWKRLRGQFDEVVLDMPASSVARTGLMVAAHCDGVIVVLEAERTRAPVVEALVASLRAVKANLLGTVLNKRRFYLPEAVYRRL